MNPERLTEIRKMLDDQRIPAVLYRPGEHLLDELKARNISQNDFAEKIGMSNTTLSGIISGSMDITADIAKKIGKGLGTSSEVWMNLQNSYNEWIESKVDHSTLDIAYELYDEVVRLNKEADRFFSKLEKMHEAVDDLWHKASLIIQDNETD